jgi:hypothetical protein
MPVSNVKRAVAFLKGLCYIANGKRGPVTARGIGGGQEDRRRSGEAAVAQGIDNGAGDRADSRVIRIQAGRSARSSSGTLALRTPMTRGGWM